MSEFEPINFDVDYKRLKNELTEVGLLAGRFVSRAALEYGNEAPITALFDNVAQRITVAILELQIAKEEMLVKEGSE